MTSQAFEAFLAKVYVDPEFRAEFLASPRSTAFRTGLSEAESEALAAIDREGLEMAVASFASKRKKRQKRGWKLRLKGLVARG